MTWKQHFLNTCEGFNHLRYRKYWCHWFAPTYFQCFNLWRNVVSLRKRRSPPKHWAKTTGRGLWLVGLLKTGILPRCLWQFQLEGSTMSKDLQKRSLRRVWMNESFLVVHDFRDHQKLLWLGAGRAHPFFSSSQVESMWNLGCLLFVRKVLVNPFAQGWGFWLIKSKMIGPRPHHHHHHHHHHYHHHHHHHHYHHQNQGRSGQKLHNTVNPGDAHEISSGMK